MSNNDYKTRQEQYDLLLRLRTHYKSASIPLTILYQVEENLLTPAGFAWSVNYGMGGASLQAASESEARAAYGLLEQGALVRSFQSAGLGIPALRIHHIEDVNWGMSDDGTLHMFMLGQGVPDYTETMNETHNRAIENVQKRLADGDAIIDDREIKLSSGLILSPIRFGRDEVLLHKRHCNL